MFRSRQMKCHPFFFFSHLSSVSDVIPTSHLYVFIYSLLASYLGMDEPASLRKSRNEPSQESGGASSSSITKEDLILDFHFYNFSFCKERRFTPKKTSTMLSILKLVFDDDVKRMALGDTVTKSFEQFESLLLKHSVERPPMR